MIFKIFKEKSNEMFVKSSLKKRKEALHCEKIKNLLVLFYIKEQSDLNSAVKVMESLYVDFKAIKCVGITDNKYVESNANINVFNVKDFGWKGHIKNKGLNAILNEKRQALISYHNSERVELKITAIKAQVLFKIGIKNTDIGIHDLIIESKKEAVEVFKNELLKYLKVLNRI